MQTMREVLDASPRLYKPVKDAMGVEMVLTESDKDYQAYCYMDRSQGTKFGNVLNKFYRGQVRKINGLRYKFADREARHSTFSIELLDGDPEPPRAEPVEEIAEVIDPVDDEMDDEKDPF